VDDDVLVSDSLKLMIRRAGWQPSICASAEEFLARSRPAGPCCLVLDVTLLGLSGLDLQKLVAEHMEMPVIFIGGGDVPTVVRAMKAGAIDFLTKPFDAQTLLTAIARALDRSRLALRHETEQQVLRKRFSSLSRREREVMALVIAGRRNKQVGYELGIAEITVKLHRRNVMRKMQAHSLAELVQLAARLNLAPVSSILAAPDGDTSRGMELQAAAFKGLSHDETRILLKILQRVLASSNAHESGSDQPPGEQRRRIAS
jgi:FixJ family two-component response regulator